MQGRSVPATFIMKYIITIISALTLSSCALKPKTLPTLSSQTYTVQDEDLVGKKFSLVKPDQTRLMEFFGNNDVQMVLMTKGNTPVYYAGDYRMLEDKISVRLDREEDNKIGIPLAFTFSMKKIDGKMCLKNIQTGECWLLTEISMPTKN